MQTLESLGVPASAFILAQQGMPEAPPGQAWVHQQQQGYSTLDQGMAQAQPNHIFIMNNVKPEQQIPRREEVTTSPSVTTPSVITATYNPTYNRCLPKILSDLDCEMKIKQVLRCIENILLENGDVDLQQQAYKLPDRSLSPQVSKNTKKPKLKEDEEMLQAGVAMVPPPINLSLAMNSPSSHIKSANSTPSTNKNPIKINVKVEPNEIDKTATTPRMQQGYNEQAVPTGSPRGQMFDFSAKIPQQQQQPQQPFTRSPIPQPQVPQQRAFSYDGYTNQPMIPHAQLPAHLSVSTPHLNTAHASSPHIPAHLHASSPHIATHTSSPNIPAHVQTSHPHANSPHMQHSPHTVSHSPHHPQMHPGHHSTHMQFNVITDSHAAPHIPADSMPPHIPEFTYQTFLEGVQEASGFRVHDGAEVATHKKDGDAAMGVGGGSVGMGMGMGMGMDPSSMGFLYDPALVAQYLAQNQHLQQQLQQQLAQQQHAGLTTSTSLLHPPTPFDLSHLNPISLSGHLSQLGPDGILQEDDKWILSLLNTESPLAHDLSLSGQILPPPM